MIFPIKQAFCGIIYDSSLFTYINFIKHVIEPTLCQLYFRSDSDSVSSIDESEILNCPSCSVIFSSNIELLKHKIVCDPQGVYEACPQCGKVVQKEKLVRHQLLHKTERKKIQFTCQTCNKTFSSRQNLQIHTDKVHNCRSVQYPCDVCGKEFSTKYRAEYHKKTIHLKHFNLHCDQCSRGFVYLTELTAHVSKVHDKNRITYVCPYNECSRSFQSKSSLQYHQQISHTTVKPEYICAQCGKVFPHVSLYRRHLTRHNQTKKFSCDLCDNRYSSKHGMEIHRRSHTGERPFVCEHCGNSFTARKFLSVHMVVHTKERPFECTMCGRSFTQKGSLNIHVKKEHSEKSNIGNNLSTV